MKPYYQDKWVTIYHGDCREILPQLPDNSVDLVLTDPPYNGGIDYGFGTNDSRDWGDYLNWLVPIIRESERLSRGPVIYFLSHHGLIKVIERYKPYWVGAWYIPSNYANPVNKGGMIILPRWEPFLIYGDLRSIRAVLPDCIQSLPNREKLAHPCPKPIYIMQTIIGAGDFYEIIDPFMGSGTTPMAAKKLSRHCTGIEIEERYCEIAANRCRQEVMEL